VIWYSFLLISIYSNTNGIGRGPEEGSDKPLHPVLFLSGTAGGIISESGAICALWIYYTRYKLGSKFLWVDLIAMECLDAVD
jgi:hypothetical protein